MQFLWWTILVGTALITVFVLVRVLPRLFFSSAYKVAESLDRGISVQNYEDGGKCILYMPQKPYDRYITRYAIYAQNSSKIFVAQFGENVHSIDYDLALFDEDGNNYKIINIKQNTVELSYTGVVELPPQTSYASLMINSVNSLSLESGQRRHISRGTLFNFFAATYILTLLFMIAARAILCKIFATLYYETLLSSAKSSAVIAVFSLVVSALFVAGFVYLYLSKDKKP